MKKTWFLLFTSLYGLLFCTACGSASAPILPTPVPSTSPQATGLVKSLPTPALLGQQIVYGDIQAEMSQAEITDGYITEYGSNRLPPAGIKFLWIHITLTNIGQQERDLPVPEHFSVLNGAAEFKPSYGHRKDYTDYTTLNPIMDAGQKMDAWLRFDIPADAELRNLQFAFLPDSTQISVGFSSSDYSWGNHPIYLWNCAP
jgi:hypothetical protein